jgi:toxin ParE1/3/4
MSHWTLARRAQRDIDDIRDYTVKRWGDDQAKRYLLKIQQTIELVLREPNRRRACDEILPGYFRVNAGSHVIFYRQSGEDIRVMRILHERMNVDDHL